MSSMNMMLWNQKDLPRPPINTCKALTEDLDLFKLRNTLQDGIKHFKDDEFLTNETAILSRMLYRMKTKFRSSKEFKLMEKLNRSLNIYFKTNVGRDLQNILEMTPTRYEKDTYLPTKNILQYVLVRLQGLAKLMERMYDMCLIIASELNQRICIGHFWKIFILLFAVISRISILLKFNTKFMCDLYGKLLSYSYKLINTGKSWLPKGYDLPSDLRTWLSVQWVNEDDFVDLTFEPTNEIMNFFNLIDDDDDDVLFCDEYIMLDDDNDDKQIVHDFNKLSPLKEIITRNRMRGFSINEDDIGEEISDAIVLNDSVHPKESEKDAEYKLNGMEDFGEEIHFTNNINTTLSSQENFNNKCRNSSNEDKICKNKTLPDLIEDESYSEYDVINNDNMNIEENSVIILDESIIDTKVKKSNKKKKKSKSNKLQDSFKETVETTSQKSQKKKKNQQHNGESTKVAVKRKLYFDKPISNKKLKTVVNISLNDGVSDSPVKRKLVKNKDIDIDNNNEATKEKVIDNDAINIGQNRNVIVLDDSIVDKEMQNTRKKRRKAKKNKSQDPFEENEEATGRKSQKNKKNKQHSGESTKVAIKRKLHFDEAMSNKKLKTVVNISLNEADTPTKRKLVKNKDRDIDNNNEAAKENIEQNRNAIVLDNSMVDKKVQNTGKKRRKAKKNKPQAPFVSAKNLKSPKKTKDKKPKQNSNKKLKTLANISTQTTLDKKVQSTKKKRKKSKKN